MSSSAEFLNRVLTDPAFHDYLAILKGARNGLVYGVKVRFPHALIMAILFGRGEYVPAPPSPSSVALTRARAAGRRGQNTSTRRRRRTR